MSSRQRRDPKAGLRDSRRGGEADERRGETPCAFVELKPGQSATSDELIAWWKRNLAGYKVPRYVVFAELRKTSTGKI